MSSKISRRKTTCEMEEIENVPTNPNDSSTSYPDSSDRAPLHAIPDPLQNPKIPSTEHEVKRTPGKSSSRGGTGTPSLLLRTPERQAFGKNRFGFSSLNEPRDEARSEMSNYLGRNHATSLNLTPRVGGIVNTTPTKSVSKPPNPGYLYSSSRHPANGSARGAALSRGLGGAGAGAPPCVVNTIDVAHFDLKEDPSFWMDHNVQVIIRVRPLNGNERSMYGYNRCLRQESAQTITWIGQPETRFTFDHVACETVDQDMLFRMAALPMVENCLSGYNSCMFAYGQTGSGKTYTMLGEMENVEFSPSPHRGMTPRIFEFLFARIRAEEESRSDEKLKYSCKCSFLEIYNEQITDLLDPSSTNLLLREDVKKGVYVENLSEFEVHTVADVLQLLIQGSSNRKVAATNMNRESSRSHCVFICIIESKWERDSVTNYRFARLNLVDLAGSERQKSSGAEGERLKEAANINKSLSTLGHVIMLLVDIAHGKARHVPYRDSRLTFLLQDSLGGNSKTMIIANVSSSICCAAETLNTLKFAQRAKLIQNNAVVNEDSSGDVAVLQQQIWLLKEELSALKRQNVSRTLAFDTSCSTRSLENHEIESRTEDDQPDAEDLLKAELKGGVRVSSKQLKSLEMMLTGALRREQMAETSMKQLEAEIEKLNCLVRQREEDTKCSKMILKFREDKIQRMESLLGDPKPVDAYLIEENAALSKEIQMLQAKVDRNPEVTRFALENIKLLEQLRSYQAFYEDGERDFLMNEVSELRAQLIRFHDKGMQPHVVSITAQEAVNDREENESLSSKLTITANELEECQTKLKSCLEANSKLSREILELHAQLRNKDLELRGCQDITTTMKSQDAQVPHIPSQASDRVVDENSIHADMVIAEEVVNLELELDILKIILKEEKLSRSKAEDLASSLTRDVQMAEQQILLINKQREEAEADLVESKSVIQSLESQQLLSLTELEDLKNRNSEHLKLLGKQEPQIALKEHAYGPESTSSLKHTECEDSPLQEQVKRMQASLDKAKRLNMWYQNDHAYQRSNEVQMDEIRRQAEAETAEVIVCLQEEFCVLQQRVDESDLRGKEAESKLLILETKMKELRDDYDIMSHDNATLSQNLQEKEVQIKLLVEDWELLSCEIEEALIEGHEALRSAFVELDGASTSNRRGRISEQMGKMIRLISDKQSLIEELNNCLEEANIRTNDMEQMLMSLRGAAIIMAESHQQECCEKEAEILQLRSELKTSLSAIKEETYMSEKNDHESIQALEVGVCSLQAAFTDFEKQCQSKLLVLNHKLNKLEEHAQKAKCSWHQKKEFFECELGESKAVAAQKTVEASCVLVRFEEVQETMKEADMMINGLMIANEAMKLEIEDLRNTHIMLTGERDHLVNEVHTLQSANDLKDQENNYLESQLVLDAAETATLIGELQSLVTVVQDASKDALMSLTHDFNFVKSQLQDNLKLTRSSLEEIWSEIVKNDCAVSVLHLCHIGRFSESASAIYSENGLLHHSICESKALIDDLREQDLKSKEEVEMSRLYKERLLSDINSSLSIISSKEDKTIEFNLKLDSINENLAVLQRQEELMLETFDFMGSKLGMLEEDLNKSNLTVGVSLVDQEQLQEENAKLIESQTEMFSLELFAKDLEVSLLASELQQLAEHNADLDKKQQNCCSALDSLVSEFVTRKIFADLIEQLLWSTESEVDHLQMAVKEARESESRVLTRFQAFEAESKSLKEQMSKKQIELENLQDGMFLLQSSSQDIQSKLLMMKEENEAVENRLLQLKSENCILLNDIQDKDSEIQSSKDLADKLQLQNCQLQESIFTLESRISLLEKDLETKRAEMIDFQQLQSSTAEALSNNNQNLESYSVKLNGLQEENILLRDELQSHKQKSFETLNTLSSNASKCASSLYFTELQNCRMLKQMEQIIMCVSDQKSKDSCQSVELVSNFLEELESIDFLVKKVESENLSLQEEMVRKDEVLNGLLFDLRLLQESAANSKDQQDEIEELEGILESTECDLATKSRELDEAVSFSRVLESKVKEQGEIISATMMDLEIANQSLQTLSDENSVLKSQVEDITTAKSSVDRELGEKISTIDSMENELLEMGNTLGQMNNLVESLKTNLDDVNCEKNHIHNELIILEGKLETAQALAGENEAIAAEAQQIAESRRIYAEEKEEEVQLLERSVQELDSTISVLENKVDVLKGEAERQRLQREELELELHSFKNQMQSVATADSDIKRHLDQKSRSLQQTLSRVQVLEKDLAHRDTEIAKCKTHISELSLHAEAQACEYKQKFKELEAMLEQFRAEEASNHERNASCNKLEKNTSKGRGSASPFKAKGSSSPFKGRGSGSPFKCIGLGLAHQFKSEKDEEISAEKLRIEELEALAASRQKEIFMLNARLATTESMTHDVMRDLLGVKLDMSSYANLLDKQQVIKLTEISQVDGVESQDSEVVKLKKQLNELIVERKGWMEEIDRKQKELMAAQIALEKLREEEQFLSTENNVLKRELTNQKRQVVELEGEVKKLSGQQNLQQRIHHHAKIKEENHTLKMENEELSSKVRQAEAYLKSVRKGLSNFRGSHNGRDDNNNNRQNPRRMSHATFFSALDR